MAESEAKKYFALIVEDTEDLANMMVMIVEGIGMETHHSNNGMKALAFLETRTPDVMLLDIGMPGMTGWEVLEHLKAKYGTVPFPIIILTAFSDPANKLVGKLQEAVFRYLTKPFEASTLTNTVRDALGIQ